MPTEATTAPRWSTSTFGAEARASALELRALGEHLQHCSGTHAAIVRLRCAAEAMHGFVTSRLLTTLALLSLPILVLAWLV